jgi:hypothetical protein
MESVNYKIKYLKYKNKYLDLKEQYGGIVYSSGDYIFFFDESIINPSNTVLLNALNQTGQLSKEHLNFNNITNEIFNNGGGWSYKKGDLEIKKIESNTNIAKAAAKSTAVAAGKTASAGLEKAKQVSSVGLEKGKQLASAGLEKGKQLANAGLDKGKQLANAGVEKAKQVSAALSEKNRLALCEKCKNANCPLVGGELEFMGGSLSFKIDPPLIELIKKSKDLTDLKILDGLKEILENNGIIGINRAIVCRITTGANPLDKPKIYSYKIW